MIPPIGSRVVVNTTITHGLGEIRLRGPGEVVEILRPFGEFSFAWVELEGQGFRVLVCGPEMELLTPSLAA